jgi:hypothetical protein
VDTPPGCFHHSADGCWRKYLSGTAPWRARSPSRVLPLGEGYGKLGANLFQPPEIAMMKRYANRFLMFSFRLLSDAISGFSCVQPHYFPALLAPFDHGLERSTPSGDTQWTPNLFCL